MQSEISKPRPSALSQSGPIFLLGALTLLIFKSAPFFWPLFAAAFVGLAVSRLWKAKGFYFSLAALATVAIFMLRKGVDPLWTTLLAISISISWLLVIMGQKEMQSFVQAQEEKVRILEEEKRSLHQQLQKESRLEAERLSRQHAQTSASLDQVKSAFAVSEKEREKLKEQNSVLERNLEETLAKLLALQNINPVAPTIVPQVEESAEEKLFAQQVQHQYDLLRDQFEEKSEALDQARKELFRVDSELLALEKITTEKSLEDSEESLSLARDLKALEEERTELEGQVDHLQEMVSALLTPKKRATRSKKSSDGEELSL